MTGLVVAVTVLALGLAACLAWASGERTRRQQAEQRVADQVDRIAALSDRATDLAGTVAGLRRDLASARNRAALAAAEQEVRDASPSVVLAAADAVADAALARHGADRDRPASDLAGLAARR